MRDIAVSHGFVGCAVHSAKHELTIERYQTCPEIKAALKSGWDAQNPAERLYGDSVVVPMFLDPVAGIPFNIECQVDPKVARGTMVPFFIRDDELVGWLDEGEGRWQMRLLLLEYLRGKYPTVPSCARTTHGKYEFSINERELKNLDSTNTGVLANVYSILTTGVCWLCSHTDTSDLVPDI
jgi:hypothetical protein